MGDNSFFYERGVYLKYYTIKEGDICVDIGASNGDISLEFLNNGAGKCFCLEPSIENYKILLDKFSDEKYKDKVFATNKAISKANEPVPSSVDPESFMGRTFLKETGTFFDGITFKTFVETNNIETIDLLKIDCEGGEYFIFTSENYNFIKKNVKNIACELHAKNEFAQGMHRAIDICKELKELGFQIWIHPCQDGNPVWASDFTKKFLKIDPDTIIILVKFCFMLKIRGA